MKSIKDFLSDEGKMGIKKRQKAFERGNCSECMDDIIAESKRESAKDFPRFKCMVTDNYFVDYSEVDNWRTGYVQAVSLSVVTNVYRTNFNSNNKYDFNHFYMCMEFKNGNRYSFAPIIRGNEICRVHGPLIDLVKQRTKMLGAKQC